MFAQLNIVQIKRFNFYALLMWYGLDLNLLGGFTVAVSLLRYVVPNSAHIPTVEKYSHCLTQCPAVITKGTEHADLYSTSGKAEELEGCSWNLTAD